MTTKKKRSVGRPKGSKTQVLDHVDIQPTLCKKCGSADRGPYVHTKEIDTSTGSIILRRTICLDCGQQRIDREVKSKIQNNEVDNNGNSS